MKIGVIFSFFNMCSLDIITLNYSTQTKSLDCAVYSNDVYPLENNEKLRNIVQNGDENGVEKARGV